MIDQRAGVFGPALSRETHVSDRLDRATVFGGDPQDLSGSLVGLGHLVVGAGGVQAGVVIGGRRRKAKLSRLKHLHQVSFLAQAHEQFAPYVGVEWSRALGNTADYIEARGGGADDTRFVVGLKAWF